MITKDDELWLPVEAKPGESTPSPHVREYLPRLGCDVGVQLVDSPRVNKVYRESGKTLFIVSTSQILSLFPEDEDHRANRMQNFSQKPVFLKLPIWL